MLGGTFDPPHLGHLLIAIDARERLALDHLLLIPNAVQPLKGAAAATPEQRLEMLRLTAEGIHGIGVDALEIRRNGLSYTVDTLAELRVRFPDAELFLLAGMDVLSTFPQWKDTARILELSTLVLLNRAIPPDVDTAGGEGARRELPPRALVLPTRTINVSSTEIRARVREGRSIRGFVRDSVATYIETQGLYTQVNG